MGLENVQNQDLNLVLSTDAKPRLKWTPELHQRFVDAAICLGGPDKATPTSLMKEMGVSGLTLYHLKSHLQKYRLGKNQLAEVCSDFSQEDCKDNKGGLDLFSEGTREQTSNLTNNVQRELHEQIEVQKHLQLRTEAQGKYLQKVLKKAQETLAAHTRSSMGVELAKVELSQLFSMVTSDCPNPSLSDLTEARPLSIDNQIKIKHHSCSTESSLTSSETSGAKEDKDMKILEDEDANNNLSHTPFLLALLDQPLSISRSSDQVFGSKRKGSSIEENFVERDASKKLSTYKENVGNGSTNEMRLFGTLDLNNQYQEDQDLGQTTLDLYSLGRDQIHCASLVP